MPAALTLHFSEVQADAEEAEGDHEGKLEVDLEVMVLMVEEVVVVRIDELQLVKSLVEDSQVVTGVDERGWNVLEDLVDDLEEGSPSSTTAGVSSAAWRS